ncbi:RHO1 GDP-GTP exchange protein 2 [Aspergillus chevalieri]|uniref:RHO1 GDP-GTP exchange protein 2 n=1 Tax=Aspergillus chevalieri TaxID=182096 RepID=A0A7R7VFX6_ASPCH|nr:RHO1 GDP-GTP exchange protein 2 [Aspergillus chevalieri]BCR83048.1 RHO1 GDP-GTP exchange protein 2 [Aspergillus chevalieri]
MIEKEYGKHTEHNHNFYCKTVLRKNYFTETNCVNCLLPINGDRDLVIGTDNGIYLVNQWPIDENIGPQLIIDTVGVTQIDILEEHRLFMILSNGTLSSYPIEVLNASGDQDLVSCEPQKVQDYVDFFKIGISVGRHLVCSVNTSESSTEIRVFQPTDIFNRNGMRLALDSMGDGNTLNLFKVFHIPVECWSVHFLRSTLGIGCTKGFKIINLHTADIYPLLDPADKSLDFVSQNENLKPFHIEKMDNGRFLLCYNGFSMFVNRNGWLAHPDWKISWKGTPKSFSVSYPYILAFGLDLVEFWHIKTGKLLDTIVGHNIRMLHSRPGQTFYAFEDDGGEDAVASLTFSAASGPS